MALPCQQSFLRYPIQVALCFRVQFDILEPKHRVRNHTVLIGHHGSAKARCLHPDKLLAANIIRNRSTFNQITVRIATPSLMSRISHFNGKTLFFKLDLSRVYHQMPMIQEGIAETNVITPLGIFDYLLQSY
nr:pol polyprotein [Hymenolepis microstoma]